MEMENYYRPVLIKLVLIGDSGAGKTCLLKRFKAESFHSQCTPTIAIDFVMCAAELDGQNIRLQIWDTAGHERYDTLTTPFYRGAHGIMTVYDITKPEALESISEKWLEKIKQHGDEDVVTMIVGNKCDLKDQRQVPAAHGEAVAEQLGARFLEVSAKDNVNVDQAFMDLARAVLETMPKRRTEERGVCVSSQETGGIKNCCCWCGQ